MASLTTCSACGGVIRKDDERACPSCGHEPDTAPISRRGRAAVVGALLMASVGCDYGAPVYDRDAGPTDVDASEASESDAGS